MNGFTRRAKGHFKSASCCAILVGLSALGFVLPSELVFAAGKYRPGIAVTETDNSRSNEGSTSFNAFASKPLVVSVPHRLSKRDALRRLKSGLESVRANYGFLFNVEEETWTGYHLKFRATVVGQAAYGSIDVTEHSVHLQVYLPWLLARLAEAALPAIRKEGASILQKK